MAEFSECPKCKSVAIDYSGMYLDGISVWQTATCEVCSFQWNEVYRFWRCEDVNTCEELDINGNIIKEKK